MEAVWISACVCAHILLIALVIAVGKKELLDVFTVAVS